MKELDVVKFTQDIKGYPIKKDMKGTIVFVYSITNGIQAYAVECEVDGETVVATVVEEQITDKTA